MTQHPITPPPELVQQCWDELRDQTQVLDAAKAWDKAIALAYQAGADQELEACCEWLESINLHTYALRAARRPKPPSLKEQALKALTAINSNFHVHEPDADIIRRALEQLDD